MCRRFYLRVVRLEAEAMRYDGLEVILVEEDGEGTADTLELALMRIWCLT